MNRLSALVAAASANLESRAERARVMVEPLSDVVEQLQAAGVQASLTLDPPVHGQGGLYGTMVVTTFHDRSLPDAASVYDLNLNPSLGTILVSTYVPTPEEDPEAYDLGARPEPVWAEEFHAADGGYGRRSINELREEIEQAFVARALLAPGPRP